MGKIINNFSIKIASANGTGSQSANSILFKTLFRMGIPAAAKNLFPSNIQGLPTWYQVRVTRQGYRSVTLHSEILVMMNIMTAHEDAAAQAPGSVIIYDSSVISGAPTERKDVIYYPVPMGEMATKNFKDARLRTVLKNIIYVGVIAELFKLNEDSVLQVISETFKQKQKAIDVNREAIELGREYVRQNLKKQDPYEYSPDNKTDGKITLDGNQAAALGCLFGGCTVVGWYPITPASALAETLIKYFEKYRKDDQGKNRFAIFQAEDELAALSSVLGAGWMGARSMTSTSGPGISLMAELTGLAYYAEIPSVIFDVQRVGPSTGLPTRTQQGDISFVAHLSHGDTKHVMLFPKDVKECFEMSVDAFDLAEILQTPIFVMSDLDLGMNLWLSDPLEYPKKGFDRGKVLTKEQLDQLEAFHRYGDVDGDGIPYRTLPGTEHPKASFFTRGSGHDEDARYTESPEVYKRNMDRLFKKFQTAVRYVPPPVMEHVSRSHYGIIAYGTSHHAVVEAIDLLKEKKMDCRYLRIRAYPFHVETISQLLADCQKVFVVEQNRDGQLADLLKAEFNGADQKIVKLCQTTGFPLDAVTVYNGVFTHIKEVQ